MRVFLDVKDKILEQTLRLYLSDFLASKSSANIIVSDYLRENFIEQKPVLLLDENARPLEKNLLFSLLKTALSNAQTTEAKIENLLQEYTQKIIEILKNESQKH